MLERKTGGAVASAADPGPAPSGRRSPWWPGAVVLAVYTGLALVLTWSWWTPLGGRITAVNGPDATLFAWLLESTPHALAEGRFPLFSDRLNVPDGVNLMWNNGMVLAAVLLAPVTRLFGGLGTVTVLTTLGLAGSATSVYACLRSGVAGPVRVLPAALGGALFGFSPAMSAQALGHPNLVFCVLVPLLVLLAARLVVDEQPRPRDAVLLGALAGAQVLIGEEVLFDTGVVVALLLLVLALSRPRTALRRARAFLGRAGVALGVFLAVAGVPLGFQLFGPLRQWGSPFDARYYSTDLAGYVTPTELQVLAPGAAVAQARRLAGGLEEHTAYLGWPLVVLGLVVLVLRWRRLAVRVPLLVALTVAVLALGPELTVLGEKQGVPMPWALVSGLPGFEHVLTTRLPLFTAGLLGAGLAVALDEALGRDAVHRAAGLAAAAVALLPLVPAPLPGVDAPRVPAFFTGPAGEALDCDGGSALVLPFPGAGYTDAMYWQQAAGMSFAMPGGYFIGPDATGRAFMNGAPSSTGTLFRAVVRDGTPRPVTAALRRRFVADLRRWNACAAVLGPGPNLAALRAQATALIGREPEVVDGVLLWRDLPR